LTLFTMHRLVTRIVYRRTKQNSSLKKKVSL